VRRLVVTSAIAVVAALAAAGAAHAKIVERTLRAGPYVVGPYDGARGGETVRAPRMNGSIVAMDANVVDEDGDVIPQSVVMLHHLVFKDQGHSGSFRPDGACPTTTSDQRFFGVSEELRALTLPKGYGYRIERQDRWRMGWMLMNHTHRARAAWIRYRVRIDTSDRLKPVTPYWFSVMGCHVDPAYTVAGAGEGERSTSKRGHTFRVPRAGRIVAVGGHLHGGSRSIALKQQRCDGRTLVTNRPTYGQPGDPLYAVKPLLHEPDPRNISWWQSRTGIPVREGEKLRVEARYRDDFPYMRVMGIDHVYIAHGDAPRGCADLPDDAEELGPDFVGRSAPPHMELTLARMGDDGYARPWDGPGGKTTVFEDGPAAVTERRYRFRPARVSIPAGESVRWTFRDEDLHDATLATGPRGFASPPMLGGDDVYTHRFRIPGTYRVYCSLHPVAMQQVVTVRGE
jgi:plastocyanin